MYCCDFYYVTGDASTELVGSRNQRLAVLPCTVPQLLFFFWRVASMALARAGEEWPSGPESSLPNLRVGDDRWCLEHGKWHAETLLFPPPKKYLYPACGQ